jgi:hypothetical protein
VGVGKRIEGQGLRGVGKRRHVETSEGLDVEASRNPEVPEWELLVHTPAVFARVANKGVAGYGTWKKVRKRGSKEVMM